MITEKDLVFIECLFQLKEESYETAYLMDKLRKYAEAKGNDVSNDDKSNLEL